jgi:hypothetical protein
MVTLTVGFSKSEVFRSGAEELPAVWASTTLILSLPRYLIGVFSEVAAAGVFEVDPATTFLINSIQDNTNTTTGCHLNTKN